MRFNYTKKLDITAALGITNLIKCVSCNDGFYVKVQRDITPISI